MALEYSGHSDSITVLPGSDVSKRGYTYREFQPPAQLSSSVEAVWSIDSSRNYSYSVRVVPDGCVEIVKSEDYGFRVYGPSTTWTMYSFQGGSASEGIRLRPEVAAEVLSVDPGELKDLSEDGERFRPFAESLSRRRGPWLLRLFELLEAKALDAGAAGWVAASIRHDPDLPVGEHNRRVGVGARHARRLFGQASGITLSAYRRIHRVHSTWGAHAADPRLPLSRLALRCGFSDQSHMTREVRELTGLTPVEFLRSLAGQVELPDRGLKGSF